MTQGKANLATLAALPAVALDETLAGAPGIVDVWCFFYEEAWADAPLARYDALLTPDERARHQRFHFERDRDLFLATRALARTVLARYTGAAPEALRFGAGEHGKPYLAEPVGRTVSFNLSNAYGLVVCAVSVAHAELGVDVERADRVKDLESLADSSFSVLEARALRALPPEERRERFFAYWTLKESYIKARGLGLAIPLDAFSFLLDEGGDVRVAFEPRLGDSAERWRFVRLWASERHRLALAVDTAGAALSVRANVTPLAPLSASGEGGT
jgi:4'-phosphopantetheinyl transferase